MSVMVTVLFTFLKIYSINYNNDNLMVYSCLYIDESIVFKLSTLYIDAFLSSFQLSIKRYLEPISVIVMIKQKLCLMQIPVLLPVTMGM